MKLQIIKHITLLLLFLSLGSAEVTAREFRLRGQVFDSKTREPLPGAEVYLSKKECGTVTDRDGLFDFTCSSEDSVNILVVSFLGYKKYFVKLRDFTNGAKIYLEPQSLDFGDEIIIRAEKINIMKQDIPLSRSIIEYKEIERYGSSEIGDILKPIPAIRIEGNDLDGRRIQIRGSNPDEVNVYLDGVLLNNVRFDNAADLSIIPVESIESLEVLRGGNSAFLGNGAFGGVVSINTRQRTEPGFLIKGKLGSFRSRYLLGDINIPIAGKLILNYFGQINELSPTIEYFPGERFSEKSTNHRIGTKKQNHNLTLNYFMEKGQWSSRFIGYYFQYEKPFWKSEYRSYLGATSYRGEIFGIRNIDFQVNHLFSKDRVDRNQAGSAHYVSDYTTNRLNARFAKKITLKNGAIQLLSEYYHDEMLSELKTKDVNWQNLLYHAFLYENRGSVAAVFSVNDYLKKLPIFSWKTYLGIRGDVVANGNKDITNMAGLKIDYTLERWKFSPYFNYGKNVKYPTLVENAYIRDLTTLSRADSTPPRLEPEYSNSSELGVNIKHTSGGSLFRSLEFSLALFSGTVYNKLLTRPFDNVIASVQIGRNNTRGIETSLKLNQVFNRFILNASFIQLDISDPLLYAYKPKKNFSLHLSCVSRFGLYFNSTFFYEGKSLAWYYDNENQFRTETITPFNDMDVVVGFHIPLVKNAEAEIQLAGYNVFDRSGFRYYYLKKRYWQMSLALRY